MLKHSFVVHSGDSMNGDVFFMEVSGQVNGRLYAHKLDSSSPEDASEIQLEKFLSDEVPL